MAPKMSWIRLLLGPGIILGLAALLAVVAALLAVDRPAQSQPASDGSILGMVTDESTGAPLSDIWVEVYDTSWHQVGSDFTHSSGNYSVSGLPTGYYRVRFSDDGSFPTATPTPATTTRTPTPTPTLTPTPTPTPRPAGTYAFEWYDDEGTFESADPVSVTSGSDASGINAALPPGRSISGAVTEEGTGTPLSDICVSVYDTSRWEVGSDKTSSSGFYEVNGLRAGSYKLQFSDCGSELFHISEWYEDEGDFESADPVAVTAGSDRSGIDASLALGGSISGKVTEEATGGGVAYVCVEVYDTSHSWAGNGYTDSSGEYSAGGFPPGEYRVYFRDCSFPATYAFEWYDDEGTFESAGPVFVNTGSDTSDIDAALALGGSIQGNVTEDGTGAELSGICVTVYDTSYGWVASGETDSGDYSVTGLRTGDYKVHLWDCDCPAFYISEWYNNETGFADADQVPVTEGSVTDEIDAALALGGCIEGTVTDESTGGPLSDICVDVYDTSHNWAGSGHTDFSGAYCAGGIPEGDYKVDFSDCWPPITYASQWYENEADFYDADLVPVTAGSIRGEIDAALLVGDFDGDGDGFNDAVEAYVGTDWLDDCPDSDTDDAWPPDINMDAWVDVGDILEYRPVILTTVPPSSPRYDLNMDEFIDVGDILEYRPVIMTQCTNP